MSEQRPSDDFERHPDIRTLQGVDGGEDADHLHETVLGKLDLFLDAPVLARVADIPIDHTLTIHSLSIEGREESVTFRRHPDNQQTAQQQWTVIRKEGDEYIEEPANLEGSFATVWGLGETDDIRVRQHVHFAYTVSYRLRFRHGSDVPGTSCEDYDFPEEMIDHSVIEQYLAGDDPNAYVCRGADGLLYYNALDTRRSYRAVTGQVTSVTIEPVTQPQ
ncbi:MAG TPA: hypothetical protein VF733_06945 [Candidatus Saccharimonadales bacterium]